MEQISFTGEFEAINDPHLACVLLIDTSKSMSKYISKINDAIMQFKESVCKDELSRRRIDISIIEFNTKVNVVQDFISIVALPPITLKTGGRTMMGTAINQALDLVKERCHLYHRIGTPCFKPWIFMITDGSPWGESPHELETARDRIKAKGMTGKLKFFAVAVDNADKELLYTLTPRVMELQNADFEGLFNWLGDIMAAISVNTTEYESKLKQLPPNLKRYNGKDDFHCY